MVPRNIPGLRPRRGRLAAISASSLVAASFALALLPLAAFANTGNVSATEDCQTWSAQVVLDNNVRLDHLVDVVVSKSFTDIGHPGFTGLSVDTTKSGPKTIWGPFTGTAPFTGTVKLVIHNPNGSVENTYSKAIAPATCNTPTISTKLSESSITVPGKVHDTAELSNATATAGGTVKYTAYIDNECSLGARSAGTKTVTNGDVPDSNSLDFTSADTVYWQAEYSGDAKNTRAESSCRDETLVIHKAADSGATQATPTTGVVGTTATFGDTATISKAFEPSGKVSFGLYSDSACTSAVSGVSGSGTISNGAAAFSTSWTPADAGVYYWKASYAGDDNNKGFTLCGGANEAVTVSAAVVPTPVPTPVATPVPASGALAASTTAPALPRAGHPTVLAPASSGSDTFRNIALVLLVLAGSAALATRFVFSKAGKAHN